jgi:hypothetical protein
MKKKERNQTGRATNVFKSLGYIIDYVGKNRGPGSKIRREISGHGVWNFGWNYGAAEISEQVSCEQ